MGCDDYRSQKNALHFIILAGLTAHRRRVYYAEMTKASLRDNTYWLCRLKKDGHDDILARINAGEITVYKGTQLAGYRKSVPRSPAAQMGFHWKRADHDERKRFVVANLREVNRVVREVGADLRALQDQKPNK